MHRGVVRKGADVEYKKIKFAVPLLRSEKKEGKKEREKKERERFCWK